MGIVDKIKGSRGILYRKLIEPRFKRKLKDVELPKEVLEIETSKQGTQRIMEETQPKQIVLNQKSLDFENIPEYFDKPIQILKFSRESLTSGEKTEFIDAAESYLKKAEKVLRLQQVLNIIKEEEQVTSIRVAKRLKIKNTLACELLRKLINHGYVFKNNKNLFQSIESMEQKIIFPKTSKKRKRRKK